MMIDDCVALLSSVGIQLEPGLTSSEIIRVERQYAISFGPEHRALLSAALPTGERWPDWRYGSPVSLQLRVDWPTHGVLIDVQDGGFWPSSWGTRPEQLSAQLAIATQLVRQWPQLVPLAGHRYMPSSPDLIPAPVFSVYQTDVVLYGDDLLTYLKDDFGYERHPTHTRFRPDDLPPWTLLAFGDDVP